MWPILKVLPGIPGVSYLPIPGIKQFRDVQNLFRHRPHPHPHPAPELSGGGTGRAVGRPSQATPTPVFRSWSELHLAGGQAQILSWS